VSNTKAIQDALRSQRDPIFNERLTRGGWQIQQELKHTGEGIPYIYIRKGIRQHPDKPYQVVMKHKYIFNSSHQETFSVENMEKLSIADVEGSDWVDWDQNGRLIVLKQGKVLIGIESGGEFALKELVDLNPQKPVAIIAPEWATEW
jgi:hypothetical protein